MDQHDAISALGARVRQLIAGDRNDDARDVFGQLLDILRPHVAWEEAGLFARIRAQGDFAEHVDGLEQEHADLYAQVAAAEENDWAQRVGSLLDDLDEHIYRENFGLFPGAIAVLDGDDWAAIEAIA